MSITSVMQMASVGKDYAGGFLSRSSKSDTPTRAAKGHSGDMVNGMQHEGRAMEAQTNLEAGQSVLEAGKMAGAVPGVGTKIAVISTIADKILPDKAKELLGKVMRQQPGVKLAEGLMGGDAKTKLNQWKSTRELAQTGATLTNPKAAMAGPALKPGGMKA